MILHRWLSLKDGEFYAGKKQKLRQLTRQAHNHRFSAVINYQFIYIRIQADCRHGDWPKQIVRGGAKISLYRKPLMTGLY